MTTTLAILLVAFQPGKIDPNVVDDLARKSGLTARQFRLLEQHCEQRRNKAISVLTKEISKATRAGAILNKEQIDRLTEYKNGLIARTLLDFRTLPERMHPGDVGVIPSLTGQVIGERAMVELQFPAGIKYSNAVALDNSPNSVFFSPTPIAFPDFHNVRVSVRGLPLPRANTTWKFDKPLRVVEAGAIPILEPFDQGPLTEYSRLRREKGTRLSQTPAPLTAQPTRYVNETYNGTFRYANGRWEGVDNRTDKIGGYYDEISRTKEYVELLQLDRKLPTRLYADHIEQKLNGKWERVASGHWEQASK